MASKSKRGRVVSLIERLEAAEVGSRELDRLVGEETDSPMGSRGDVVGLGYERLTTYLDAALALAERVLIRPYPWVGSNRGAPLAAKWSCELSFGCDYRAPAIETDAPTPALALCIAILRAKEAK